MEQLYLLNGKVCKLEDITKENIYKAYPIKIKGNFGSIITYGYISKTNTKEIIRRIINAWGKDRIIIHTRREYYYMIQDGKLFACKGLEVIKADITEYVRKLFVTTIKRLKRFGDVYNEEIDILSEFLTEGDKLEAGIHKIN